MLFYNGNRYTGKMTSLNSLYLDAPPGAVYMDPHWLSLWLQFGTWPLFKPKLIPCEVDI